MIDDSFMEILEFKNDVYNDNDDFNNEADANNNDDW